MSGTFKQPLEPKILGVVPVPQILEAGSSYRKPFEIAHEWLAYALVAAVAVHATAALYRHFVRRDTVLRRMLTGAS